MFCCSKLESRSGPSRSYGFLSQTFGDREKYGDLMNYAVLFPVSLFIHQTMEFATTSCKLASIFVCSDCQQHVYLLHRNHIHLGPNFKKSAKVFRDFVY